MFDNRTWPAHSEDIWAETLLGLSPVHPYSQLFGGFVAAEITYFNFGILAGILFAIIYAFMGSRLLVNSKEKFLARSIIIYYLISLFFFFVWNTSHVPLNIRVSVLARSLLGIVYNIPPLIVLHFLLHKIYQVPAAKPIGSEALAVTSGISPAKLARRKILYVRGKRLMEMQKKLDRKKKVFYILRFRGIAFYF